MSRLGLLVLLALLGAAGCGSEREFSGIWRTTACGEGLARADCDDFVYELHLGRYGDRVAGLVVRYVFDRSDFDNFQRPQECGCYFIEGGLATETGLQFRLFEPKTGRFAQPDTLDTDLGCGSASLLQSCSGHRFELTGDTDLLEGITDCDREDEMPLSPVHHAETPIRFERVVGQPRTECYTRRSLDP